MKFPMLLLWLCFGITLQAQFVPVEELQSKLQSATEPAQRAAIANQLAEELLNSDPARSISTAQQALDAARSGNNQKEEAAALSLMAVGNYKTDHSANAKDLIQQSAALAEKIKDNYRTVFCKYWQGRLEETQGQYNKALEFYQSGIELAEANGDKKNLARCTDGKASIFLVLNNVDKALELYEQSLQLAREAGFKEWVPGELYSLAAIALDRNQTQKAVDLFNESARLSDEVNNQINKASCLQQLAGIALNNGQTKDAIDFTNQAMEIFQATGSMANYSYSQLLLADVLVHDGQVGFATEMAQKAYGSGKNMNDIELQKAAAEKLFSIYMKQGDKSRALDYHIELSRLTEAGKSNELAKKLTQLELQEGFEKEKKLQAAVQAKKDAEMQAQLETQRIMRNASLVGLVLLLIIAGLAYYALLQKQRDNKLIEAEKKKSDALLLNILPAEVAEELKEKGAAKARNFEMVSVMFADIRDFTQAGESMSPEKLVYEIDYIFRAFDEIVERHGIEKIKTIGDAYLCAGGLPKENVSNPSDIIEAALEMQQFMLRLKDERMKKGENYFEIRIGIHSGPLVAGIVGVKKFAYDIWGDTVNVAARMEQSSEVGKVNISGTTYGIVGSKYHCTYRGKIDAKHKGQIDMYFVDSKKN
ncbi:MAG: adenylate/guanylate cyclase domain-containing protein [Chitinophagales bacterium]